MFDAASQGAIWSIFSNQVGKSIIYANVEDMKHMGMLQFFEEMSFLQKLLALLSGTKMCMQEFDGNSTFREVDMFPSIDFAKTTGPNLSNHAIIAYQPANVSIPICHRSFLSIQNHIIDKTIFVKV